MLWDGGRNTKGGILQAVTCQGDGREDGDQEREVTTRAFLNYYWAHPDPCLWALLLISTPRF